MNIMLTEEDFYCLISGGIVCIHGGVKIALQDIGFQTMIDFLVLAMIDKDRVKTQSEDIIFK